MSLQSARLRLRDNTPIYSKDLTPILNDLQTLYDGASTEFDDSTFVIYDNADNTKKIMFEVSGITTGTTRTYTPPNASTNLLGNNIGIAGGSTIIGGTAASETLTIYSTSHATKGKILFGTSAYDEANNRLGIGLNAPTAKVEIKGAGTGSGYGLIVTDSAGDPILKVKDDKSVGINTASPASLLEVTYIGPASGATMINFVGGFATGLNINDYGHVGINTPATGGSPFNLKQSGSQTINLFDPNDVKFFEMTTASGDGFMILYDNDGARASHVFQSNGSKSYINNDEGIIVGATAASGSACAIIEAVSTTKGVRVPNMTTVQKNAIVSPVAGLIVYDTTLNKLCIYTTAWETITSV